MLILDLEVIFAGFQQTAGGMGHVDHPQARIEHDHAIAHLLQTLGQGGRLLQGAVRSPARLRAALGPVHAWGTRIRRSMPVKLLRRGVIVIVHAVPHRLCTSLPPAIGVPARNSVQFRESRPHRAPMQSLLKVMPPR